MAVSLVEQPKARVVLFFPKLWEPQWPMWSPLDMYCIQTALMHAGYEVTLIDERMDGNAREWLALEIPGALFVGISGKFGDQCRNMMDAAAYIKSIKADCPVVAGGWLPSLFPAQIIEGADIDIVVEGPGDVAAPALADALLAGRPLDGIPGIWFQRDGRTVSTPFGHLPKLEETHPIPWDLVGIKRYIHPHGWLNYFSSRGCPGGCQFCAIYCLDPHRWTALPAQRVVDEWEFLAREYGVEAFKIVDTDFCADVKRVESICRMVLERGLNVRFEALARHWNMKRMTDEQVALLRVAGCTELEVGIETGSQRLSDMIDKKLDVHEVMPTLRRFVAHGIRIKANIMLGIPTETKDDLKATFRLIEQMKDLGDGIRYQIFRYTPLPDAPMNKQVWNEGRRREGKDPDAEPTLAELLALPINDDPADMYWVSPAQERSVKRAFYFYAPLAYFTTALESARGKPVWRLVLRALRPLAVWRNRHGVHAFPFEMWLNALFGRPLPRAEDDGVTPHADVLPAPPMGETFNRRAPLPAPELVGAGVGGNGSNGAGSGGNGAARGSRGAASVGNGRARGSDGAAHPAAPGEPSALTKPEGEHRAFWVQ